MHGPRCAYAEACDQYQQRLDDHDLEIARGEAQEGIEDGTIELDAEFED